MSERASRRGLRTARRTTAVGVLLLACLLLALGLTQAPAAAVELPQHVDLEEVEELAGDTLGVDEGLGTVVEQVTDGSGSEDDGSGSEDDGSGSEDADGSGAAVDADRGESGADDTASDPQGDADSGESHPETASNDQQPDPNRSEPEAAANPSDSPADLEPWEPDAEADARESGVASDGTEAVAAVAARPATAASDAVSLGIEEHPVHEVAQEPAEGDDRSLASEADPVDGGGMVDPDSRVRTPEVARAAGRETTADAVAASARAAEFLVGAVGETMAAASGASGPVVDEPEAPAQLGEGLREGLGDSIAGAAALLDETTATADVLLDEGSTTVGALVRETTATVGALVGETTGTVGALVGETTGTVGALVGETTGTVGALLDETTGTIDDASAEDRAAPGSSTLLPGSVVRGAVVAAASTPETRYLLTSEPGPVGGDATTPALVGEGRAEGLPGARGGDPSAPTAPAEPRSPDTADADATSSPAGDRQPPPRQPYALSPSAPGAHAAGGGTGYDATGVAAEPLGLPPLVALGTLASASVEVRSIIDRARRRPG